MRDTGAPRRIERLIPRRHEQEHAITGCVECRNERGPIERDVARRGKAEEIGERCPASIEHCAQTRRGTERLASATGVAEPAPRPGIGRLENDSEPLFEK
jgi:hypothetical protein